MGILDIFKKNDSELHSPDVRKRVDRGVEIVKAALKQHPSYRIGRHAYSYKKNDMVEQIVDSEVANQGGIELYAPGEEKPEALVHFETGFPNRPIIFVKKGRITGTECKAWKSIQKALQKEGKYPGIFAPNIRLVDRKHSLSVDHFYDSRACARDGQTKPKY